MEAENTEKITITSSGMNEICQGCTKRDTVYDVCLVYPLFHIWGRMGGCPFNRKPTTETKVKINPLKLAKRRKRGLA